MKIATFIFVGLQLALLYSDALAENQDATAERPNVIVIMADDVGWGDAGCYGATKLRTPHIDRLANEGCRFDNAHSSATVCTPTRYSLLTGQYSWRQQVIGLNKGVAPGDSRLLIPTDSITAPKLLQAAGYRTAVIGKWHLGFGTEKPNFNQELRPGPLEVGFHEFFGIPATNDRVPTVLVRDHRVVGLDPADPLYCTFNEAEAKRLDMKTWAAGRNRIGWAKGGKAAWWKDTDLADTHLNECIQFLDRHQNENFFLLYTPHNVHAPAITHPRFSGSSGISNRADMLIELDASIGKLLETLDRLKLSDNTLIIYSSDNGAYVIDEEGHKPNGPFRGKKSQLWDGGSRVPLIMRWPKRIPTGVSASLASTIDIPYTICSAAGIDVPADALPDSFNLLPLACGQKTDTRRDHLVTMSGTGELAIRSGNLKFIPDISKADGWYTANQNKGRKESQPGLFHLLDDPSEQNNLASNLPNEVKRLQDLLTTVKKQAKTRSP